MRHILRGRLFRLLGVIELLTAGGLVLLSGSLPTADETGAAFGGARELAGISRKQIDTFGRHTETLRDGTHELTVAMSNLSTAVAAATDREVPMVGLSGGIPELRWQRIWPEEYDPAARLQRIAAASAASEQVLTDLSRDLPTTQATLADMESALDRYGRQTAVSLSYGRMLLWLVASIAGLHSLFVICSAGDGLELASRD